MKLVIGNISGLDLLRHARATDSVLAFPTRVTSIADSAHTAKQIAQFEIPAFERSDGRLHVLVPKRGMRTESESHLCHLWSEPRARGSLICVGDGVFASSPELCFLHMATHMSPVQAAPLGYELCGAYSPAALATSSLVSCAPVTSTARLNAFLSRMAGARGANRARTALSWVRDGAASPMEAGIALALCLPARLGGYGLPFPTFNPATRIARAARGDIRRDTLRCDLHWPDAHLALEYDSTTFHTDRTSRDARRMNALATTGETVLSCTPSIVADAGAFEGLALQIARGLGRRIHPRAQGLLPQRDSLRRELFPWLGVRAGT